MFATSSAAGAKGALEFAVIKTAQNRVREGMTYRGGSFRRTVTINYAAFVVRRGDEVFLFDTGLGERVDEQYRRDMPRWKRPILAYGAVQPASVQLRRAGLPVRNIVLSHGHWDHASGLVDFPGADIWLTPAERAYLGSLHEQPAFRRGAAMPSQITEPSLRWRELVLRDEPYRGFGRSLDVFGDGSAVMVPLEGHTPGSVGLFLTVASGQRYFLCGDAVWNAGAIRESRPKSFLGGLIADCDRAATQRSVEAIRALVEADPSLVVVPSHDGAVHDRLGYFPQWVR